MSTIRNIITESLQSNGLGHYTSSAEPVIAALVEREEQAIETLREQGLALGASEEQIESILVSAGLVAPAPEPEQINAEPQSLEAMIATLTEEVRGMSRRLDSASSQAARHGIRF